MNINEAKQILEENGFLLEEEDPRESMWDAFESVCADYPKANVAFGDNWGW